MPCARQGSGILGFRHNITRSNDGGDTAKAGTNGSVFRHRASALAALSVLLKKASGSSQIDTAVSVPIGAAAVRKPSLSIAAN